MLVEVTTAKPYQVQIGFGVRSQLAQLLPTGSKVALLHPPTLKTAAQALAKTFDNETILIEVPDAEAGKTSEVLNFCWTKLASASFTRNDMVIGFGGGATTDLAGFVAATWLRGVRYIAVPTSLLGMVDAGVGGKTGINLASGKNLVGAFWEPQAVFCDLELLNSLPVAEFSNGMAEVIKCGFIADEEILSLVEEKPIEALDPNSDRLAELVRRAVKVKADVVSADLHERTSAPGNIGREALNYGHTLGHAIEAAEGYTWRHGAAISVGMIWIAEVSAQLLGLAKPVVSLHRELLAEVGLPISYHGNWEMLRAAMRIDKKSRGSDLRLIGLLQPGQVELIFSPDEQVLTRAWSKLSP